MRYRITLRGEDTELRGFSDNGEFLARLAGAANPMLVLTSLADDDYNPFMEQHLRELHHFETEQILEQVREALKDPYKRASLQNALNVLNRVGDIVNSGSSSAEGESNEK